MSSAAEGRIAIPGRGPGARMPLVGAVDDTTWKTLFVFCGYRIVLALLVAAGFVFLNNYIQLGAQLPGAVAPTLVAYLVASVLLVIPAWLREPSLTIQVTAGVVVDVFAIVLLMHASGGVRSGLGVALLVSLAAAGLISRGRLAFFHAAVAALAVLFEQAFQLWRYDGAPGDFMQAGLTSVAFFATAGLGFTLARYARTSERIAAERQVDLDNLSQINELVIRDMQDGILVVDGAGAIRQHNPRAAALLGALPPGRRPMLAEYAPEIAAQLESWRSGGEGSPAPVRSARSGAELQAHFVAIGSGSPRPCVVFVEDAEKGRREAQQMKLVALGRLTASIAHEIRNPLSSIGHAAELLGEGAGEGAQDGRLVAIIRDNVFRLDRMVQEVLYLNRRDRAQPEAIEPRGHIANFIHDFATSERVPESAIAVDVRTAQRLWFDRQHLDQVLWNLARNAWRHGRQAAGSIRIVVAAGAAPGTVTVSVRDDGPGVDREVQAHIFEPFFTTDAQGTGLGLYIARELCEGNGARLDYTGGPGGGEFRVTTKGA